MPLLGNLHLANIWSVHRDTTDYDRADDFVPGRFLRNKFGTRNDQRTRYARRPRSEKHREVVMRDFETAKDTFALYED